MALRVAPKPDAAQHVGTAAHCRALFEATGFTQVECARRLGLSERTVRHHLTHGAPYLVEYALAGLAGLGQPER